MQKTTFVIPEMDCPSEDSLLRLKLDGMAGVRGLDFDLPSRRFDIEESRRLRQPPPAAQQIGVVAGRIVIYEFRAVLAQPDAVCFRPVSLRAHPGA